ncbi:hypothetical protein [Shinella sp. BYT-45]|uniref:hypothetical protein n=1 Tax=Shinella sp. BYT-45 TaxID=3377377 RepID=UPI003980115D
MLDMFGLAMLFELSQKSRCRRKHEFDHLREARPVRAWFRRIMRSLHGAGTTKGPA